MRTSAAALLCSLLFSAQALVAEAFTNSAFSVCTQAGQAALTAATTEVRVHEYSTNTIDDYGVYAGRQILLHGEALDRLPRATVVDLMQGGRVVASTLRLHAIDGFTLQIARS